MSSNGHFSSLSLKWIITPFLRKRYNEKILVTCEPFLLNGSLSK